MKKYLSIIAVMLSTSFLAASVSFAAGRGSGATKQPVKTSNSNGAKPAASAPNYCPNVPLSERTCQLPKQWDNAHCGCYVPSDDDSLAGSNSQAPNPQQPQTTLAGVAPTDNPAAAENCRNQISEMAKSCGTKAEGAKASCDADSDDGITSAKNGMSQMIAGAGVQSACTAIGKALGAANAAIATFSQVCDSERRTCVSSCSAVRKRLDTDRLRCYGTTYEQERSAKVDEVKNEITTCSNLDAKVQQGVAAVNNTMGSITGAQNCAAQVDTTLLYCKQNPTAAGCNATASDCSNPAIAASNPICICRNSADPSCSQANSRAADGSMGNSDMSSSGLSGGAGANGAGGAAGGLDDVSWQGRDWKPGNSSGEDPGGDKGGRPIQDGSAGGGGGSEGGGGPGERTAVNVNSGLRGGGGSGSGSGGFFASEEGGGRGGSAAGGNQALGNPDLRNFLPGGKYDPKTRGIAGISGPDGITGPHSNIWQKINNRYQAEKPKLIP